MVRVNILFIADIPQCHARFGTAPTNNATLNTTHNGVKLKHAMMGTKLWNSLNSKFQIESMGSNEGFKMGGEYDGPMLRNYIRLRVKLSTKVGVLKIKEEFEKKELRDFGDDVTKFNTWFADTIISIISKEGEGCNKYLRQIFRAYLGCDNAKFKVAVETEQRAWIQNKLAADYSYLNLMNLGMVT